MTNKQQNFMTNISSLVKPKFLEWRTTRPKSRPSENSAAEKPLDNFGRKHSVVSMLRSATLCSLAVVFQKKVPFFNMSL